MKDQFSIEAEEALNPWFFRYTTEWGGWVDKFATFTRENYAALHRQGIHLAIRSSVTLERWMVAALEAEALNTWPTFDRRNRNNFDANLKPKWVEHPIAARMRDLATTRVFQRVMNAAWSLRTLEEVERDQTETEATWRRLFREEREFVTRANECDRADCDGPRSECGHGRTLNLTNTERKAA